MSEEITSIRPDSAEEEQETSTDRTSEQFEKLKAANRELKKERDGYKDILTSLKPSNKEPVAALQKQVPPAVGAEGDIKDKVRSMVDKEGFLDGNKLVDVLDTLDKKTREAETLAKKVAIQAKKVAEAQEQQQKTEKMQKVHAKYPQLDPNSESFDEVFYEAVRNDLIGQMMSGKEDPMAAADKWNAILTEQGRKEVTVADKKEEIAEKQSQKEQINAVKPRSSSMSGYYSDTTEEDLRAKVRAGKKGALAEVLSRYEKRNSK